MHCRRETYPCIGLAYISCRQLFWIYTGADDRRILPRDTELSSKVKRYGAAEHLEGKEANRQKGTSNDIPGVCFLLVVLHECTSGGRSGPGTKGQKSLAADSTQLSSSPTEKGRHVESKGGDEHHSGHKSNERETT